MARRSFRVTGTNNSAKQVSVDWTNDLAEVLEVGVSVTPQDYGAVADGVTDDSAAFVAALAYLKGVAVNDTGSAKGSPRLFIPAGHYYLGTTTLDITHSLVIEGESNGMVGGVATKLRWAGAVGIRFQRYNTTGNRVTGGAAGYGADGSILRSVFLDGGYSAGATSTSYHAIDTNCRVTVEDCQAYNWGGNGLNIVAAAGGGTGLEGNANCFAVSRFAAYSCQHGIYVNGADANAGVVVLSDTSTNRGWGVNDESFLGNTYVACHASGNTSGPYRTTNANASTVLLGCYAEGGQPVPALAGNTLVQGGTWGGGIDTGVWTRASTAGNMVVQPVGGVLEVKPPIGVADITIHSVSNNPSLTFKRDSTYKAGVSYSLNNGMYFDMPGGAEKFRFVTGYYAATVFEIDDTGANLPSGKVLNVGGTKVVGAQGAAVADATDAASAITQLNALLARCRAHGLIAA